MNKTANDAPPLDCDTFWAVEDSYFSTNTTNTTDAALTGITDIASGVTESSGDQDERSLSRMISSFGFKINNLSSIFDQDSASSGLWSFKNFLFSHPTRFYSAFAFMSFLNKRQNFYKNSKVKSGSFLKS